ncbi:type VI secretion system baseplate subunit TssE [Paraburkholderia sp. HP33-1]|uniref:type VI secretion system baseplate subunit TssE n=1 Tax=Paraburkholderia sp. HP33-1 TaxID=2883243 RepID=UPI001F17375E|nr:type VI secretion system baseplate subunit TssE [Paraburkholderia sp. HP33-1]
MPDSRSRTLIAPMPLFERLADDAPFEREERVGEPAARMLDADGLRASVRAELLRLLNTRRGKPRVPRAPDVLLYGLPDWSAKDAARAEDRAVIEREIAVAIRVFEPRLRGPRVKIEPEAGTPWRLCLRVMGTLRGNDGVEHPVTYVAGLDGDMQSIGIVDERLA